MRTPTPAEVEDTLRAKLRYHFRLMHEFDERADFHRTEFYEALHQLKILGRATDQEVAMEGL